MVTFEEAVHLSLVGGLTEAQIRKLAQLRERIKAGKVSEGN